MNEPLIVLFIEKVLVAEPFSPIFLLVIFREIFFDGHSSGQTGSNDTGLEFKSYVRAEKKGGYTDRQILSILYRDKSF